MQLQQIPAIATLIGLSLLGSVAEAAEPLVLEARIPLGEVSGRLDHLAYDAKRGRLIVAELGNNSVSIVDPDQRTVTHRITGLNTPQGVAYLGAADTIYVASAGDGLVRRYKADNFTETGRTDLGNDAYHGPCPDKGDPPHRYTFTVYALSVEKLDVPADSSGAMVVSTAKEHLLGKAVLIAHYGR